MTHIHYRKAVEQDFETIANMFAPIWILVYSLQ